MIAELLSPQFRRQLAQKGYPVADIEQDILDAQQRNAQKGKEQRITPNAVTMGIIYQRTGTPATAARDVLTDEDRDVYRPRIGRELRQKLQPWITTETEQLPSFQTQEIARASGLTPETVTRVLTAFPIQIPVNGSCFTTAVQKQELSGSTVWENARQSGVSPKRAVKAARYKSRPPGGGAVQKAKLVERNIATQIRTMASGKARIIFTPFVAEQTNDLPQKRPTRQQRIADIQKRALAKQEKKTQSPPTAKEIILKEPNGEAIYAVFEWFKNAGTNNNWLLGNRQLEFARELIDFAKGRPTDFLIWNCIGFTWYEDPKGNLPTSDINSNEIASITKYFSRRIQEVAEIFSSVGNPQITILIPSNEAFDTNNVWIYRQPYEEREQVIEDATSELQRYFQDIPIPDNARVRIMRWDSYLKERGAKEEPQVYSQRGEQRIRQSEDIERIKVEALRSGYEYLKQQGVRNVKPDILLERRLRYYGVYAGEGVAYEELKDTIVLNVVIVNFEELRPAQMAIRGAKSNLSVVTPLKQKEIDAYNKWEKSLKKKK